MVDIVALNQKILYFTQKGYLISHRNHRNHRNLILIVIGARMFITEESEKKRKNGNYQLNQSDFCVRFLINLFCIVLT